MWLAAPILNSADTECLTLTKASVGQLWLIFQNIFRTVSPPPQPYLTEPSPPILLFQVHPCSPCSSTLTLLKMGLFTQRLLSTMHRKMRHVTQVWMSRLVTYAALPSHCCHHAPILPTESQTALPLMMKRDPEPHPDTLVIKVYFGPATYLGPFFIVELHIGIFVQSELLTATRGQQPHFSSIYFTS